jgi:hypothetical protein
MCTARAERVGAEHQNSSRTTLQMMSFPPHFWLASDLADKLSLALLLPKTIQAVWLWRSTTSFSYGEEHGAGRQLLSHTLLDVVLCEFDRGELAIAVCEFDGGELTTTVNAECLELAHCLNLYNLLVLLDGCHGLVLGAQHAQPHELATIINEE